MGTAAASTTTAAAMATTKVLVKKGVFFLVSLILVSLLARGVSRGAGSIPVTTATTTYKDTTSTTEKHQQQQQQHDNFITSSSNVQNQDHDDGDSQPFCKGMPMTMFMDGFHWSLLHAHKRSNKDHDDDDDDNVVTPSCLSYFVHSWLLADKSSFHGAMLFSFLLAFMAEGLAKTRHVVVQTLLPHSSSSNNNNNNKQRRRLLRATILTLLYGLQAMLGYILMFVAMTFSIELLLSLVAGLMTGNALFLRLGRSDDHAHRQLHQQ